MTGDLGHRALTTATLGAGGIATYVGMPWPVIALAAFCGFVISFIGAVMPQESGDRLTLLLNVLALKDEQPNQPEAPEPEASQESGAAISAVGSRPPRRRR